MTVLNHYADGDLRCKCCGEDEVDFLTLDHINDDGSKQRKELGMTGARFYLWLIRHGFPTPLRILCFNCNIARSMRGACPHERSRQK